MAVNKVFYGTEKSGTDDVELVCYQNTYNDIYIAIETTSFPKVCICLDKTTALELLKTLRSEINKMVEE